MADGITTTLGALVNAEPALQRLAAERLPVATAFRVARLITRLGDETKPFYEARNGLIREHGTGDGDAARVTPDAPGWRAFVAAAEQLAAVAVTIPVTPIDLAGIAGLQISAADLLALAPLLAPDAEPA